MSYSKLFKYRYIWMGIATIWVVLFHSKINLYGPLNYIKEWGYGGVDIFLFASGLGCYYSLSKNEDSYAFYKRRIVKLMPTYLCVVIPWIIWKMIFAENFTVSKIIGNLLTVQHFTMQGDDFAWYVSAIFLFYLIAPYFYSFIKNQTKNTRNILVLIFLILVSFSFFNTSFTMSMTRVPIFFIGMLFGKLGKADVKLSVKKYVALFLSMCFGFLLLMLCYVAAGSRGVLESYGLYWYPFILITPGLCIGLSLVFEKFGRNIILKFISNILKVVSEKSLEVYLVHIFLFEIFEKYIIVNETISNLIAIVVVIPSVYMLNVILKVGNKLKKA